MILTSSNKCNIPLKKYILSVGLKLAALLRSSKAL